MTALGIILWVLGLVVVASTVIAVVAIRRKWSTEDKQAELDYQIKLAIDKGDHDEADRLRRQKLELMIHG